MVQKSALAFDKVSELDQMGILYQTESFLTACISLVQAVIVTIAVMYEHTKRTH